MKVRRMEKVVSKNGRTYYRTLKRGECIDCSGVITAGYTRCHTCRGVKLQSDNFDKLMSGDEV